MSRAILFDFNGVIVDDEPQHCEALIATLADYGYTLDPEQYYQEYLGFDDRACFRYAFARMGRVADPASVEEATRRKATRYEEAIRHSLRLVPGVEDFIRAALADAYRLAVVSGALGREVALVLEESGLRPHFEVIIAAEDVTACKPDPEGYNLARAALEIPPEGCVVIEDSLAGLQAARAAGLRCAMVATSHSVEELGAADRVWPDLTGRHPRDLPWDR
jgi:phosphoglycolate phosphatase